MRLSHVLAALPLLAGLAAAPAARAAEYGHAPQPVRIAPDGMDGRTLIQRCITAAAAVHRLPAGLLIVLLNVEGGKLGRVSGNTNGTVDIGPMQINQIWLPRLACRWNATVPETFLALRDNFCANVEAGAWILRTAIDAAGGDLVEGMGRYHSATPVHKERYLGLVRREVLRQQALLARSERPGPVQTGTALASRN